MTASSSDEGLVKKLFFPAYGESGGFGVSEGSVAAPALHTHAHPTAAAAAAAVLDTSVASSVASEASTAVRDNRSQPTASVAVAKQTNSNHYNINKLPTRYHPPFFASTKPAVIVHPQHVYMTIPPSPSAAAAAAVKSGSAPVSPPKVSRLPVGTHDLSNTAVTHAARSNAASRLPLFVDATNGDDGNCVADDASNSTGGASFKDAASIAIVQTSGDGRRAAVPLGMESEENWRMQQAESDGSSTTMNSKVARHQSIFDDTSEAEVVGSDLRWEEEATPAQSAFGKMLLFRRNLINPKGAEDDIFSVASENGSIADTDVNPAILAAHVAVHNDEVMEDDQKNASTESGSTNKSSLYTTPQQDDNPESVWDDTNLALPVFDDENNRAGTTEDEEPAGGTAALNDRGHHEEKTVPDPEHAFPTAIRGDDSAGDARSNQMMGATGMLSMAIRRLGSGLAGGSSSSIRSSLSAPSTPRASSSFHSSQPLRSPTDGSTSPRSYMNASSLAPLRRGADWEANSSRQQHQSSQLPSSFLLRSPGSTVFQAATVKTKQSGSTFIPPRFTSWQGNAPRRNFFGKIPEDEEAISARHDDVVAATEDDNSISSDKSKNRLIRPSNHNAFQIARSCFSFDAYDTSMDDQYEFTIPNHYSMKSADDSRLLPTLDLDPTPPFEQNSVNLTSTGWINTAATNQSTEQNPTYARGLSGSASWDVSSARQHQQRAPAFRPRHGRTRGGLGVLRPAQSYSISPTRRSGTRARISSDFSPSSSAAHNAVTTLLKSPQRIEIEREDALDILACLVERGVSWKQDTVDNRDDVDAAAGIETNVDAAKSCVDSPERPFQQRESLSTSVLDIAAIVKELQDLSLAEEVLGDFNDNSEAHRKRKLALEELLRSHEYAVEMKRASQSASSWLKSIGRSQSSSPSKLCSPPRNTVLSEEGTTVASPVYSETSPTATTDGSQQAAGEESSASENIDLLTATAMLHSAQIEAKEKSDLADRLNEELVRSV